MKSESFLLFIEEFKEITGKYPQFFNNLGGLSWFRDIFQLVDKKIIYKILMKWKSKPPDKKILSDLKESLNHKTSGDNYIERLLIYQDQEERSLIYLLIFFGLQIEDNIKNSIKETENKINKLEENLQFLRKLSAGKKIANYIEEAMDDEFELKPLRTRIDMRKIKDLYNKNESN